MSDTNQNTEPTDSAEAAEATEATEGTEATDTLGGDTLGGDRPDPSTSASKDPSEWVTGDEPMTGPQRSYLDTLAHEAGETLSADITKAEASEQIDRLQQKTGRGQD